MIQRARCPCLGFENALNIQNFKSMKLHKRNHDQVCAIAAKQQQRYLKLSRLRSGECLDTK